MVGHVARGAVRSLVACTEKLALTLLVNVNRTAPLVNAVPIRSDWVGAGMLNAELVTAVNPLEVNMMVAVVTAAGLSAVRFVYLAEPATAALLVVPPSVH